MSNHTILLIDYEPKSIDRVKRPLSGCGYRVEVATDGIAGMEAFHRLKPDLVMIEAMIPKKHGFEVCQEIKKTPQGKRTPIIITTSVYKGRKYRNQAFHIHGCDEYLEKPLDEEQIVVICRRMLGDSAEPAPLPLPTADDAPALQESLADFPLDAPTATPMLAPAPHLDDDELEILARLDAILPGGGSSSQKVAPAPVQAAPPVVPATPAPPAMPAMASADPAHAGAAQASAAWPASASSVASAVEDPSGDPFATSFLGSGAAADIVTESAREPIAEPTITIEDDVESGDESQVVSFESRRSRKKDRKSKKNAGATIHSDRAQVTAVATAHPYGADDMSANPEREAASDSLAPRAATVMNPRPAPDLDALLLDSEESSRPWWISVALAVLLLGAAGLLMWIYLGGLFGGPAR